VFALPFKERSFDFVYSQGVIMHTHSTKGAFDCLARLPKTRGRLYVWVYNQYDEQRSFKRRILMKLENLIRPFVSRLPEKIQTVALLPIIPLYLVHQNRWERRHNSTFVKYGWRESVHAARDRFTPRFAHRHTEKEVRNWFAEANYIGIRSVTERQFPRFVPTSLITACAVDGIQSGTWK
jgi:SAM-dependent methyltransferase